VSGDESIFVSVSKGGAMSFLDLFPQISIPPIEPKGVDDPAIARRFADSLAEMQRDLKDGEALEVVTFLPSGAAVTVESVGYQTPTLIILQGQEQASGKDCTVLVHQSSLQILISVEKVPVGQRPRVIALAM
jgi:hypothetical protein